MELAHPEAILRLVEAGLGAAVLPERVIGRESAPLVLVRSFYVRRRLGVVVRKGEQPSSAARAFLELVTRSRGGGGTSGARRRRHPRGV
jgi:DNA-binding transcriptional LysR family regulator